MTVQATRKHALSRYFPFLAWLPELKQWRTLRTEMIAGLTVAMLLIPQSMAYAHLAGLPVYMGLYAAFIPTIVAALFGSSRVLSTGPVPVTSLLTAVAMQPLAAIGTDSYLSYVVLLTLLSGLIQIALGLLRFGVVVHFISHPVILGFINAVALIIASMQLSNLLGIYAVPAPHYYQTVWQVLTDALINTHWPSVGIASLTFAIILGGRMFWPDLPHTIIAVVVTALIAWATGYEKLKTVNVNQIINLPVQKMVKHSEAYPDDLKKQQRRLEKKKDEWEKAIKVDKPNSKKLEQASQEVQQAAWELQRLIRRHQFEVGALNRIRFHSVQNQIGQWFYYVDKQMTPIGKTGPYEWRIDRLPKNEHVVLQAGGEVVGKIPAGLPGFHKMSFSIDAISALLVPALIIALLGFAESITIAKRIATENRQRLSVNQELIGQGLAKCAGSFFQAMPVSGGFSRTAVNAYVGAKTGFSSVVAGLVVMLVLLWLTPLFYYLPYATLAALIIVGALGLFNAREMWQIWKVSRREGVVVIVTFAMTLVLAPGIIYGILLGMLLSLGIYLYETMRPRFGELTRNEQGELVEVGGSEQSNVHDVISVVRFHGSLYFGNSDYFEHKILNLISKRQSLRYIILDGISINKVDATGLLALKNICLHIEDAGIELWFARTRHSVLEMLKKDGLYERLGPDHFHKNIETALKNLPGDLGTLI